MMTLALCFLMPDAVGVHQAGVKQQVEGVGCAVYEQEQENAASPFFERGRVVSVCLRENQLFPAYP